MSKEASKNSGSGDGFVRSAKSVVLSDTSVKLEASELNVTKLCQRITELDAAKKAAETAAVKATEELEVAKQEAQTKQAKLEAELEAELEVVLTKDLEEYQHTTNIQAMQDKLDKVMKKYTELRISSFQKFTSNDDDNELDAFMNLSLLNLDYKAEDIINALKSSYSCLVKTFTFNVNSKSLDLDEDLSLVTIFSKYLQINTLNKYKKEGGNIFVHLSFYRILIKLIFNSEFTTDCFDKEKIRFYYFHNQEMYSFCLYLYYFLQQNKQMSKCHFIRTIIINMPRYSTKRQEDHDAILNDFDIGSSYLEYKKLQEAIVSTSSDDDETNKST